MAFAGAIQRVPLPRADQGRSASPDVGAPGTPSAAAYAERRSPGGTSRQGQVLVGGRVARPAQAHRPRAPPCEPVHAESAVGRRDLPARRPALVEALVSTPPIGDCQGRGGARSRTPAPAPRTECGGPCFAPRHAPGLTRSVETRSTCRKSDDRYLLINKVLFLYEN